MIGLTINIVILQHKGNNVGIQLVINVSPLMAVIF